MTFKNLNTLSILLLHISFLKSVYGQFGECIDASNTTLFSTSPQYADAYSKLNDVDQSLLDFVQCQIDFVSASIPYDETCELDFEMDPMFDTFLDACKEAGGILYVEDSAYECSKAGVSINVAKKMTPVCVLEEETSCEGFEDSEIIMNPEFYSYYTELGYICRATQLVFYPYEDVETETPATNGFNECVSASNDTLVSLNPQYLDAQTGLFESDKEWQDWSQCQTGIVNVAFGIDAACSYDWRIDPLYDTYWTACEDPGGILYVSDFRIECSKVGYDTITLGKKNTPFCIWPAESSCEGIQDYELTVSTTQYEILTENGYSCTILENSFHPLNATTGSAPTPVPPTPAAPTPAAPTPAAPTIDAYTECLDVSNETLFSTSTQYIDAFYELFDGGPLWSNFRVCQEDFLNAIVAYNETCTLDRKDDSMFIKYVDACRNAGGSLYLDDSAFECIKAGSSITVTQKSLPSCLLPSVSYCEGIDDLSIVMLPQQYAEYTEMGYDCQPTQLDFYEYPYENIEPEPETDPPAAEGLAGCISSSNETLFSKSPEYVDAFSKLYKTNTLWQKFVQCQADFLEASTISDEACVYDWGSLSAFITFNDSCQGADGTLYLRDATFECSKSGSSITVTDKNQPYCLFPEATYCTVLEGLTLNMKPENYAVYTDQGYDCQAILFDFYEPEPSVPNREEPENTVNAFDACIIASNKKLFSANPQYEEAYSEMFDGDAESDNWIECQTDFLNEPVGNNVTCNYDYKVDFIYDTYIKECQEASGSVYLADYHVECHKTGRKADIRQKNNPYCMLPEESPCKEVLTDIKLDVHAPLNDNFTEAGYTCTTIESKMYPLEANNTSRGITPMAVEEDNDNLPIIIGIVVGVVVVIVIIGIIVFVFYDKRKKEQTEATVRKSSNVIEQEDAQKKRMEAMTQAIQAAAIQNAVYETTVSPPPVSYGPTVPAADIEILESVPPTSYNYGIENE